MSLGEVEIHLGWRNMQFACKKVDLGFDETHPERREAWVGGPAFG